MCIFKQTLSALSMTVKVTLSMSPEDAQRLLQAFKDGKLAELGVTDAILAESGPFTGSQKKWTGAETDRHPKQDDLPPHG